MAPTATQTGNKRLLKLADFIETVHEENWDFGEVLLTRGEPNAAAARRAFKQGQPAPCGSQGCALGWAPACFPRDWEWMKGQFPRLRGDNSGQTTFCTAQTYFDLSPHDTDRLFAPHKGLGIDATPQQVAANIRAFVKERQQA